MLELIRDSWRRIGIRLFAKPLQLTLFRRRVFSGETLMSIDKGIENGLADGRHVALGICADQSAAARMAEMGSVLRDERQGRRSSRSALALRLKELYEDWLGTASATGTDRDLARDAADLGRRGVLDRHRRRRAAAGRGQRQAAQRSRKGIYNWDPGAFFGIYKPDHSGSTTSDTRGEIRLGRRRDRRQRIADRLDATAGNLAI